MNTPTATLLLVTALFLAAPIVGCQGSRSNVEDQVAEPDLNSGHLTLEVWQQSTSPEKYGPEILYRLKREDPQFKSASKWKEFHSKEVEPKLKELMASPAPN